MSFKPSSKAWTKRRKDVQPDPTSPPPYERDRARLIHSSGYRKLQAKTQVLGIGEGDFHRTRLTHTQEVAQVGRGIVSQLKRLWSDEPPDLLGWLPDPDLIEAICLAHDLGHPPFGHGGEIALDFCMRQYGGFEGNGQTLRVIALLESHTKGLGLNLTRRCMLGVLKYPACYSILCNRDACDTEKRPPLGWKPPKCYLDSEKHLVDWILKPFPADDIARFTSHEMAKKKDKAKQHHITLHKSLDCSIMDIADEIAYSIHDLEDAVALGLLTEKDWKEADLDAVIEMSLDLRDCSASLFAEDRCERKGTVGKLIHMLMLSLAVERKPGFKHPLLAYNISFTTPAKEALKVMGSLVRQKVIKNPKVRSLEWRGQDHVRRLFEVFFTHGQELIPAHHLGSWKKDSDKARDIADFIAGMTDEYATRMFERLFTPRQRTIYDRL